MQGIYKITNLLNNKTYIGRSNNIERRWKDHQRLVYKKDDKEYNKVLYKAFRKHGIENFKFEIIEELNDYSIAGEREKYWINHYNSLKNGYNEDIGGYGGSIKGHCKGENNGRVLLTEEDVRLIRQKYSEGIGKSQCYEFVKEKISFGGFSGVWSGKTWKHIMPEVYTEENKKRNAAIGRGQKGAENGKKNRKLTPDQVKDIREMHENKYKICEIHKKYPFITERTIRDVYNRKSYKDII